MKDRTARSETRVSAGQLPATAAAAKTGRWRRHLFGSDTDAKRPAADPDLPDDATPVELRRDPRMPTFLSVRTATVDAVRNPRTGEVYYETHEAELITNISRRGLGLRCARPPTVGSRLLLEIRLYSELEPVELIGRTCWSRVEILRGVRGRKRAVAAVGLELLAGSKGALERYDCALAKLQASENSLVATPDDVR